jgi:DNA (cytosine-5)-methyltransferase 1
MFSFIDLFAGIGGFRLALESLNGVCVFSSEIDRFAQKTYEANFGEVPYGDIKKIDASDIPQHDVLCAGFPCQPFSLAGTKSGENHTSGDSFLQILRVVDVCNPEILFLENVVGILSNNKGKTFEKIKQEIEGRGYYFYYKVINSNSFLPQNRKRVYMVCVKNTEVFNFFEFTNKNIALRTILETEVDPSHTLSAKAWLGYQTRLQKNRILGKGFGTKEADLDLPSNTLTARYDGRGILIPQENKNPRLLTVRECARLQGFPDSFIFPVSRTQTYKQLGNSVSVPVVRNIAAGFPLCHTRESVQTYEVS